MSGNLPRRSNKQGYPSGACRMLRVCLLIGVCLLPLTTGSSCEKKTSCKCEYGDGSVVDLSPLDHNNGNPLYVDVQDTQQQDMFSWNPCSPFNEGDCNGVAACQVRPQLPTPAYYTLGSQDSATFQEVDGKLTVQYSGDQAGVTRTAIVTLTCINSGDDAFVATGEKGTSAIYEMELRSVHACKNLKGGLSAGSILLIIFFSLLGVYLIVGIPYQIFVKKESGRRVIPLIDHITKVPALAKEGVMFVASRGKRAGYQPA